ncbi:acyltransferase [Thalassotalea sp. M1531]|uniref:Acyltransferase n=1 Tax=Thalassotalea algicola TaxID=2716224 RepID=A0A7Y0Q5A7_9GAMM|nr:acyltransferase [Thalassotalea algicola]NMP30844.1 acyltransferase [Thalassotalea algicola]
MTNSPNFIQHLHAFRGFAILNVVGAHAWSFMIFWTGGLNVDGLKWLFWLTETIFHGSTLYFAIISGLLFSRVLAGRDWSAFYQSKLINVLLPYIVTSFALTALYWQFYIQDPAFENTIISYFEVVAKNLVIGKADIHFWYIPVLMVMFLTTPLLTFIQNKSNVLTCLIILIPLVISRSPFPDFIKPQTFIYFIGAYMLGMAIGANYQKVEEQVAKYQQWLIVIALATSCALFLLYVGDYQHSGFYSIRQTLVYLQKVAICLVVLYWLSRFEHDLPKWLLTLGTYAFAIFFLHVVFIGIVITNVREWLDSSRTVELVALFGSVNFIAGIGGSIVLAAIVKRFLGKHSKKFVGV